MNNWKFENFEPLKFFPTLKKTFNLPRLLLTKIMKKGWLPQAGLPWNPPGFPSWIHLSRDQSPVASVPKRHKPKSVNLAKGAKARPGLMGWDVGCRWVWPFVCFCLRLVLVFFGNRKINFPICRYMYCVYIYGYIDMCTHWNTMDDELQLFHTTLWAQMYDIC